MNIYDSDEPRYVISIAARMVGVHVQTLRYYERAGLIEPSRSRGNTRIYSTRDVNLLVRIKSLIDDLGVNLAGVDVILRMADRMEKMEKELQNMRREIAHLKGEDNQGIDAGTVVDEYSEEKER